MPIQISTTLKRKLPEGERENVEDALWDRSAGFCHLCDGHMNRAADAIEADHDIPESEGGPTNLENLRLAHRTCNRAKRNAGTTDIRPYLQLSRFIREGGGRKKYDGVLDHFRIAPGPVHISGQDSDTVTVQFSDNSQVSAPVFSEAVAGREVRYAFIELPRAAIHSDADVQPRVIQEKQALSIYRDLMRNPLYEPPGCRVVDDAGSHDSLSKLLMFDGQHKTIATWMAGRDSIVAKVYFDFSTAQANELVNSIQAKIKKLALSAFEISAKMADEFEHKMQEYEEQCQELGKSPTEQGFLESLPQVDRNRGKNALQEALISNVIDNEDLRILAYVKRTGPCEEHQVLTENQFKDKLVKQLLNVKALTVDASESDELRRQEASNITRVLNVFSDFALAPDRDDGTYSPKQELVASRLKYQIALSECARLLLEYYKRTMILDDSAMWGIPNAEQWADIELAIQRLVEHPVWSADLSGDKRLEAVEVALTKNQGLKRSLADVGLGLSYLVMGNDDSAYRAFWSDRE